MTVQVRVGRYSGFSVGIKCNLSDLDAAGRFVLGNGLPDIVTAVLVQCVQLKKVLSILVLAIVAVQFAFAGDVITKDVKELPLTARNFINQYFSKPQISYIKIDSEFLSKKYEVTLTDRTEIDFDKKGNWMEVDCKKNAVPAALIPASVKDYVKANFPNEIITKIERKSTGIEVELANDFSLKFNKKGQFVSLDD